MFTENKLNIFGQLNANDYSNSYTKLFWICMNPEQTKKQHSKIHDGLGCLALNKRFRLGYMKRKEIILPQKLITLPVNLPQQKPKKQFQRTITKSYFNIEFNPQELVSKSMDIPKNSSKEKAHIRQSQNKIKKQLPFQQHKQVSSKIRLIKQMIQQRQDKQFSIDGGVLGPKELRKGSMTDKLLPKQIINYEKYCSSFNTTNGVYRKKLKIQLGPKAVKSPSRQEIKLSGIKMQKGDNFYFNHLRLNSINLHKVSYFDSKIKLAKQSFLKIQRQKKPNQFLSNTYTQKIFFRAADLRKTNPVSKTQNYQEIGLSQKRETFICPWQHYQQTNQY